MQRYFLIIFTFLYAGSSFGMIEAPKPLWEIGIGAAHFKIADYPGSDESQLRTLALPYFIYRGEVVRSDDEGALRGRFLKKEQYEFDLSVSGSFPVDDSKNQARDGMEGLDWLWELGPKLTLHLVPKSYDFSLDLGLPLRYVISTDFKRLDERGYTFAPFITYKKPQFLHPNLQLRLGVEVTFATRPLLKYFYEVPDYSSKPERPEYRAQGGFMEFSHWLGLNYEFSSSFNIFVSGSGRHYGGTSNIASPLLKSKTNYSLVLGFVLQLFESTEKAKD